MRGFTLLEVLVALAVLAIALAAIIRGVSANAFNSAYLRDRTFAHWVAENRLAELQVDRTWPGAGESKGTAMMAGREWYWKLTRKETPDPDVLQIVVEVRADPDDRDPVSSLDGYLGRPR